MTEAFKIANENTKNRRYSDKKLKIQEILLQVRAPKKEMNRR